MPDSKPGVKLVKLICAVLHRRSVDIPDIIQRLSARFGPIDLQSKSFDFIFTDYYASEMGGDLKKQFLSFESLVLPDKLPDIKNAATQIERDLLDNGNRTVNIDPGYLEESKLVLASTKNFAHRIYLRDNVWAEITLRYIHGKFVCNEWTYPDYSQPLAIDFLNQAREIYRAQI